MPHAREWRLRDIARDPAHNSSASPEEQVVFAPMIPMLDEEPAPVFGFRIPDPAFQSQDNAA